MNDGPRLVQTIPIRISNAAEPDVEVHQFPLLTRPLQVPPIPLAAGKRIRARSKPETGLFEVHVPADTREDVWNGDRAKEFGAARTEEDADEGYAGAAAASGKKNKEEPAARVLREVRMRSEVMSDRAVYMLGVVRDGELHLHPVSRTLQFRPTMTYLDVLARKTRPRRQGGAGSDSDDGPPPDPDEPPPPPTAKSKTKAAPEAREVQLSAKKANDDKFAQSLGSLTQVRKDMLMTLRQEAEESWEDWEYCDAETKQAKESLKQLASQNPEQLKCNTTTSKFYRDVPGSWF
ncbi:hypothetical protein EXIGLDRAFT_835497 [Exidia glandulosa HHB12029]|uniref:DNA-directed RNA polymerase III subunit Rpc5 n=1 Tax=Exidia glandulosa HHB12029 TaxID=1314781 RepID=A0A165IRZ1_EXIGL|nr:hypothetical protein EXIGLDRAFT_835497 [Exidia glandulosa HHB12029]